MAAAAKAKVEVKTNIPLTCVAKYADWVESKQGYADQIKVTGTFDGSIEGVCYLPIACLNKLEELDIAHRTGQGGNDYCKEKLRVVAGRTFQILRTEQGKDKHTEITLIGGASPQQQTRSTPQGNGQQAAQHGRQGTQTQHTGGESPGVTFARLKATMTACIKGSVAAWKDAVQPGEVVPYETIAATAHSLFIESNKRGILSPLPAGQTPPPPAHPMATVSQIEAIKDLCEYIGGESDKMIDKVVGRVKAFVDVSKLTETEASGVVLALKAERLKIEREEAAREQPMADNSYDPPPPYSGPGEDIPF